MYLWDNLFDVGVMWITVVVVVVVPAQTEGDTGYDYNDAYEDSYDESSGQSVIVPPVAVQTIVHRTINYTVLQKIFTLFIIAIPLTTVNQYSKFLADLCHRKFAAKGYIIILPNMVCVIALTSKTWSHLFIMFTDRCCILFQKTPFRFDNIFVNFHNF